MGQTPRIVFIIVLAMAVGVITSITTAFADDSLNQSNPFSMIFSFFQELKYGLFSGDMAPSEVNSAAVILQLKGEVEELKTRINSIENPAQIYSTELHPITDIDCSSRNMVDAFLSGWCPHPTRNIYFIEDSRVQKESVIAITLEQKIYDENVEQSICGVINQDTFNFSFRDDKTGKVQLLENLHGFIMKCDPSPANYNHMLKYTIINS